MYKKGVTTTAMTVTYGLAKYGRWSDHVGIKISIPFLWPQ